jgi:ABC-type multidrug transport system ATPase subunit
MGKLNRTGGEIHVNGVPAELHAFKKIIGYVPQEDIMLKELTVREVIEYSARIRLPRAWSKREVDDHVDTILKALK